MTITILGLGPGDPKYLTEEANRVLENTHCVYVRSLKDPSLSLLLKEIEVKSFDQYYEVEHAEGIYVRIARAIIDIANNEDIVYAVPGDPFIGEYSVGLILKEAIRSNIRVRIIHGVSFLEPLFEAIKYDPFNGIQILMADELVSRNIPNINPDVAVLIAMIIWPVTTHLLYERLNRIYPQAQQVVIVERAGTADEKIIQTTIEDLKNNLSVHPLSCIFIPKSDTPSVYRILGWISKLPQQVLNAKKEKNSLIASLSSIDVNELGRGLRGAYEELRPDVYPDLEQTVRWETIQYLIGRFIADEVFRTKYLEDSNQLLEEYNLSEREKLLLSILDDWNNMSLV